MSFVGIDLAWVARNRTGLAVVDDAGALVASGLARGDAEIAAWLQQHAPTPLVVALDAPLVVTNPTGQRYAERLIGRAFGRYHASAHVSNLTRSWFDPPRARVLAQAHGWAVDPELHGEPGRPVGIEVYPHPAMVAFFGLDTVLPYKAKKGRDVATRRTTFGVLMDHLETLTPLSLGSSPRWAEIRGVVETATRQVDLEVVEDEIDGIFCAHLAWLWHHRPESLMVYGSLEEGFIVAPPAPSLPQSRP